ncbi:hypothetical protein [Natronolimnobius baerhuensis]|uniref:Uncharacterized protein n=1 Tax=Natronolimnobius baerhuensis TaxID=253108 RepID=A0A202EDH9_9EURY|nr:hypothetical protein [Natronolimnobius baerhuensis]OVE86248.1 hypothetical protein B2G88_05550 [Natronolimnobius baerhuensis]
MWAVEVLATGGESTYLVASSGGLDAYRALAPPIRAGGQFLGTLVIALVVLGLLQESGPRSVRTVRRSPIISCCIGLPGALVIAGLAQTGSLLLGSSLGIFFGIPFVIFGLTVLPLLTTIGVVAIGQTITTRVGRDGLGAGVLAGSALAGLAGLSLGATLVLASLAAILGVGAGARVLFAAGGSTQPEERTVPPANKI